MSERHGTRYMCSILENMRALCKTLNFSYLPALIEEAQYRAERMENAIEAYGGYDGLESMEQQRTELKAEIKELKKEKEALESADKQ